jgi:glycerol-1-phosphate dehydrogenase [NAD(P)+]
MGALERAQALIAKADPDGILPRCEMQEIEIGPEALFSVIQVVGRYLAAGSEIALIVDSKEILRAGQSAKEYVRTALEEKYPIRYIALDDGHPELHASETVIEEAVSQGQGVSGIVTIGGGTISDIGKMTSVALGNIPHVVIQTAASVDGFTDNVSVILKSGVKRTVPSRWPEALIGDTTLISEGPIPLNRAGYGEINSMFTAPADWRIAALLGFEKKFHWAPIELLHGVGEGIEDWAPGLKSSDIESIEKLVNALAVRGIVTGVADTTACLSGIEHLISHMLDMSQSAHHKPVGQHGAQVGVGSVIASAVWEIIFEELPHVREIPEIDSEQLKIKLFKAFHDLDQTDALAQECWRDFEKKIQWWHENREVIESTLLNWEQISSELRSLIKTPEEIIYGLASSGSAMLFSDLDPVISTEVADWAVAHSHLMRNRFVGIDLLEFLGKWNEPTINRVYQRIEEALEKVEARA